MNKIYYKYTIDKLLKIDKYIINNLILNFNEF